MRRWLLLTVFIAATLPLMAEEEPVHAKIRDSVGERIPTHTVAPTYPRKARRDRIEAEVQVCFDIDRAGKPRRIAVRQSTNRAFERPSIRAVKASRFQALADDKELQSIKSCRTFIFSLESVSDLLGG